MLLISEKLSTDSRRMLQNGVPQFVGFCRCTPCRQRRGKEYSHHRAGAGQPDAPRAGSAEAKIQRAKNRRDAARCTPCRQRRGKGNSSDQRQQAEWMHPVQAAPRQRWVTRQPTTERKDAPRAGSAEAKKSSVAASKNGADAPRAGSAEAKVALFFIGVKRARCTPCRQRRGKDIEAAAKVVCNRDAPRAGSAEAKAHGYDSGTHPRKMHPVQAAPRQSVLFTSTCRAT